MGLRLRFLFDLRVSSRDRRVSSRQRGKADSGGDDQVGSRVGSTQRSRPARAVERIAYALLGTMLVDLLYVLAASAWDLVRPYLQALRLLA